MSEHPNREATGNSQKLVIRRLIPASAKFLFQAWTEAPRLKEWWGPTGVRCVEAHIDLRVGGIYRIGNQFPDGAIVWITGEYELVTPPRKLIYTWRLEDSATPAERVTVEFQSRTECTEVIVTHEQIACASLRKQHEAGWLGCLDGLMKSVPVGRTQ